MSKKSNLTTLRKTPTLNLYNFNTKFYLLGYNFLTYFKQLLLKKQILLCKENVNFFTSSIHINGDLFFKTKKIKMYKDTKLVVSKNSFFKNGNILLLLNKHLNSFVNVNLLNFNFHILNTKLNKPHLKMLLKKFKSYASSLFARRFGLFIDFVKISSLFYFSYIDLKTYLYTITEVFKFLKKRSHSRFFSFLKIVFNVFVSKSTLKKFKPPHTFIQGLKLSVNGRLKGKTMASSYTIKSGLMPEQSLSKDISFAKFQSFTQNLGVFGFKLWVFKK